MTLGTISLRASVAIFAIGAVFPAKAQFITAYPVIIVVPPPIQTYAVPKPDNRTPTPDKFKANVDPPEPAQAPKYVGR